MFQILLLSIFLDWTKPTNQINYLLFTFLYFQNMSKNLASLNASFTAFSSPEKDTDLNECGICLKKKRLRQRLHLDGT